LAALFGVATTDGLEGVVTVWPHAQASADNAIAKSLFDTSAPLRNVDAAIVQQQFERIAALLTSDGEWTVSALSAQDSNLRPPGS
jgi:predicted short-subunit dehydrogenase-like oxidoreductase (DUF2520 family)